MKNLQFLIIISTLSILSLSGSLQAKLPFFQYCTYYNYPVQKHIIRTEDNYTLQFYRIQKKNTTIQSLNKVVYLQHGLFDSSDTWIVNHESLAPGFLLANKGYDVWLGNSRGNKYSSPLINTKVRNFWNFTFDQLAAYDIPAAFQYISQVTNRKIHYVGHSQGTLIMFIALSLHNPIVEKNIASFSAMGPVVYLNHQKSKLFKILSKQSLFKLLKGLHVQQLLLTKQKTNNLISLLCKLDPLACQLSLLQISQMNNTVNNLERMPVVMGHFPAGTSLKNVEHFNQYVNNGGVFSMFNYGAKQNMIIYGTKEPPKYDLKNINFPVHLLVGKYDRLADVEDSQRLFSELINSPKKTMKIYDFGHATFIWGKSTVHVDDVVKIIEEVKP